MPEDSIQEPKPSVEELFGATPFRFRLPHVGGKLPAELQGVSVHRMILFFECQFFKAFLGSAVPS
jgi:hypothetical protein